MDLYVVRHAIAFERDARRWPDDRDRPLTAEGEKRFRRAARGMGSIAGEIETVLASPLARAWRTAEILAEDAGWPAPKPCEELEPDRPAAEAAGSLRPYRLAASLAIVGHEPSLSELIAFLITGSEEGALFELKKGGCALLELDGFSPGGATLRWLLTPKIERALPG